MKVRFLATARRELLRASDWYDDRNPGLGDRFLDEVARGLRAIVEFPEAHIMVERSYRRCLLSQFPYALVFRQDETLNEIVIVAVAHGSRKPRFWRHRERTR